MLGLVVGVIALVGVRVGVGVGVDVAPVLGLLLVLALMQKVGWYLFLVGVCGSVSVGVGGWR